MILCVTPNPAIDRTLILPGLVPGNVHRAQNTIVAAGGKGLNVARSIHILGGEAVCMGFAGGHSGRLLADLARNDGLRSDWTWIEAETRTCTILVAGDDDATVINEPGSSVSAADWDRLQQDIHKQLSAASLVCISGSLPPDSSASEFHGLLELLVRAGRQVWVDTSGLALQTALAQREICIKVNGNEIGEILGLEVRDFDGAGRALTALEGRGLKAVVITLGSLGALLATGDGRWRAQGPQVEVVSTVASGDAFLGGLVAALDAGRSVPEALGDAVAAGTANTLSAGGGIFTLDAFEEIRRQVRVLPS